MSIDAPAPREGNARHRVPATASTFSLLAELLRDQQTLATPVERFSQTHGNPAPATALYRDLIPLSAPAAGEQYAFEVSLDRCTGCKACVAGCHSLNGLDEGETWRDVGVLVGTGANNAYQQTITTACHHCADPGCLNGCPVLAYEKDPVTGIVSHLDDQCIGCQYCVLKCPYDVPKYNERLGIVRKCDLCHSRLAAGEAPACVQACPTQAIRIIKVSATVPSPRFPEAAPSPDYTRPTTRYVSKNPIPTGVVPGDAAALRLQPAHWPLVLMLVATQAGTGLYTAGFFTPGLAWSKTAGAIFFVLGLIASVAHLGQPTRAWRVFLNLRKSWLSREAVVFGAALGAGILAAALKVFNFPLRPAGSMLEALSVGLALAGVFCSAMIYADTRRAFWRSEVSLVKFFGTVLIAGASVLSPWLAAVLMGAKLLAEGKLAGATRQGDEHAVAATARLLSGPLRTTVLVRIGFSMTGVLALFFTPAPVGLCLLLCGEIAERYLYFRAVFAPKMPGVPTV